MIIVTGGAGFIGSAIAAALDKPNCPEVVICDWIGTSDKWKNIRRRSLRHAPVRPDNLFTFLEENKGKVKAVIHMGAFTDHGDKDFERILDYNVRFSYRLFDWCAANKVRLIYASSSSTYGDGEQGFNDSEDPIYLAKLTPLDRLAFSKHLLDKYFVTSRNRPPGCVGLKFFDVYGPNEYYKGSARSLVTDAFIQAERLGSYRLYRSTDDRFGDGEQVKDMVYIKDVARIVMWLLDHPKVSGIYNVGTGEGSTCKEIVETVFKTMGRRPNIDFIDMPEETRDKYQSYAVADTAKLLKLLGQSKFTFTSLKDGAADYYKNYLKPGNLHI